MPLAGAAATVAADPTDDFVREQMKRQRIPGVAIAVVKDGVVIKAEGYGVADRKTGTAGDAGHRLQRSRR